MSNMPHPSDIYGRPTAPSEINLQFTDDATIAPDDSVSQLGRRFTGRAMLGPRPLASSTPSTIPPPVPEASNDYSPAAHQWVPPEMLQDDRSTLVAPVPGAFRQTPKPQATMSSVHPGASTVLPGYMSPTLQNCHSKDDEDEEVTKGGINAPLMSTAAGMAGRTILNDSSVGSQPTSGTQAPSGVSAYKPRGGYAAIDGNDQDDASPYAAYRARNPILQTDYDMKDVESLSGQRSNTSKWVNPLGYVRSTFGSSTGQGRDKEHYSGMPGSFELLDNNHQASRASLQSLDVAERQDRERGDLDRTRGWKRLFWDNTSVPTRIDERKRGQGVQRWPIASWGLSVIFTIVLAVELARMAKITGSAIQTKPAFNVMIGPSGAVLINLGARFAGCMKFIQGVTDIDWVCLKDSNKASSDIPSGLCTMSEICGFGGFTTPQDANQSFRFFVPIFLHAGVVHLLVNVLAQCFSSALIERMMGTPKFLVLYLLSGIFGFVLGANYALVGLPSVGASGAIFGTHAALLVDLLAHWSIEHRPGRKLMWLSIETVAGLALGLVPGIDNFAHLGGFLMGLLISVILFPVIHQTKTHRIVFWVLRAVALPLIVILFVVLIRNFYTTDPGANCSWCRYLSCIPTNSNNHCKGTGLATATTTTSGNSFASLLTIVVSTFIVPFL
ncbi:hypothetical protein OIO90_002742 [Microbotryomycetes sp. JL221]|nr:hypothetical protein OIO90_002742 [Microbotryomycetes sp. JL221]